MNFKSHVIFESRRFPGVTAELRSISRGARIKIEKAIAPLRERERLMQAEATDLDKQLDPFRQSAAEKPCSCEHDELDHQWLSTGPGKNGEPAIRRGYCTVEGCSCRHPEFPAGLNAAALEMFARQAAFRDLELNPALIRCVVRSISGIDIDGVPATVETQIESGPDELTEELAIAVKKELGLSGEESKNSARPTTSREKVDGPIPISIAPTASAEASIETETAEDILLTK